jgi:hypothetical protein
VQVSHSRVPLSLGSCPTPGRSAAPNRANR